MRKRRVSTSDRGPRGRGGLARLGDALDDYLQASGLGAQLRDWPVYQAWSAALGAELAWRARPVAFRRDELVVEVNSAAHLAELRAFTGERYRLLANQRLGAERIRRVTFKLKP